VCEGGGLQRHPFLILSGDFYVWKGGRVCAEISEDTTQVGLDESQGQGAAAEVLV
jgi:hypothetical protein